MPLNVILFGPPGSGKGTVSEKLIRDFGLHHISAGDLLRAEVERHTAVGRQCAAIIAEGNLIPDSIVIDLVCKVLESPVVKERGALLDGFPRTLQQAQEIHRRGYIFDVMVVLDVDGEKLLRRCLSRRLDPVTGKVYNLLSNPPPPEVVDRLQIRSDDTRAKHNRRMEIYYEQKNALVSFYRNIILEVDGNPPMKYVYYEIKRNFLELIRAKNKYKNFQISNL
ncbi:Adenylate kinase/AAA domain containing protein, putative [Angomonas deanei]|uniref:Adenylate kinase/AAA domain containing protein, putative n=1 Tax=Angomonas deanei TaxID=59799 RepID=A0A7G2C3R7_9TRYP|nr:Adenylate kinase/AAA domain containing protein, putative [Angomonas deanei]